MNYLRPSTERLKLVVAVIGCNGTRKVEEGVIATERLKLFFVVLGLVCDAVEEGVIATERLKQKSTQATSGTHPG